MGVKLSPPDTENNWLQINFRVLQQLFSTVAMALLKRVKSLCVEDRKNDLKSLYLDVIKNVRDKPILSQALLCRKLVSENLLYRNFSAEAYFPSKLKEGKEVPVALR